MMVFLPLLTTTSPVVVSIFFGVYMSIAAFELTPTDDLFEALFTYKNYKAYNSRLEQLGFETFSTAKNMGLLVVLLSIITGLYLLLLFVMMLECCIDAEAIKSVSSYLKKKLFWDVTLGFFLDAYLEMIVCVFINLHLVSLLICFCSEANSLFFYSLRMMPPVKCLTST